MKRAAEGMAMVILTVLVYLAMSHFYNVLDLSHGASIQ
jgi:hypothetical protein